MEGGGALWNGKLTEKEKLKREQARMEQEAKEKAAREEERARQEAEKARVEADRARRLAHEKKLADKRKAQGEARKKRLDYCYKKEKEAFNLPYDGPTIGDEYKAYRKRQSELYREAKACIIEAMKMPF